LTAENPTFAQVVDYPFSHPTRIFFTPSNHNEIWITSFGGGLRVYDPSAPITTTTAGPSTTTTAESSTTTTIGCPSEKIYGEDSEEVALLRYLRDNLLSQTPEGQEVIRLYYQLSPVIVKVMEKDEAFKDEVKEMIDGVLGLIEEETE
jgi:hypothetical protein